MRKLSRSIVFVLLLAMVLTVFAPMTALAASGDKTITIFHTNDIHGVYATGTKSIGFDLIAAYRKETPNSLLIDAGDFSQGQPIASITKGQAMLDMMVAAGYDYITVGNHEFDYSARDLQAMGTMLQAAGIPMLTSAAGTDEFAFLSQNGSGFYPYDITTVDGVKIGIFAVTTPDTFITGSPTKLANVDFKFNETGNPRFDQYVTESVAALENEDCDIIIAVTHTGYSDTDTEYSSGYIAGLAGGKIDLIIDGHDHASRMDTNAVTHSSGTLIVSTGTALEALGKVEIVVDSDNDVLSLTSSSIKAADATVTPDPVAAAAIEQVIAELEPLFSEVIGTTKYTLWGGHITNGAAPDGAVVSVALTRRVGTNLAALSADASLWQAQEHIAQYFPEYEDLPMVCFHVGGDIRATIPAGEITVRDVLTVMPFGVREYYILTNPATLYKVLENGVSALTGQDGTTGTLSANGAIHGRFAHVAGMTFTFDMNEDAVLEGSSLSRVKEVKLADGTLLDPTDETTPIVLVTTEYEAGGGDGYKMLIGSTHFDDNDPNSTAFIKYVKEVLGGKVELDASYANRITMINVDEYTDEEFTYELFLAEDGEAITEGEFQVLINGETFGEYTPDENGKIEVTLPSCASYAVSLVSPSGYVSSEGMLEHRAGLVNHYFDEAFSTVVEDDAEIPDTNPDTGDPMVLFTMLSILSAGAVVEAKRRLNKK